MAASRKKAEKIDKAKAKEIAESLKNLKGGKGNKKPQINTTLHELRKAQRKFNRFLEKNQDATLTLDGIVTGEEDQ